MRWFKHMVASTDDEKISRLMDACGLAGYGFFWRVMELIAAQVDASGKNYCSYSKRTWCMKLAINHQTWGKMIATCGQVGLFIVAEDGQEIKVESPNILKYRDEWTERKSKNSGVTREKLPPSRARSSDPDPDPETEEEINTQELKSYGKEERAQATEDTSSGVCDSPPTQNLNSDPGIEFLELREYYNGKARAEGQQAGFAEYKQLRASKTWPGQDAIYRGIDLLAEQDHGWKNGYAPGLAKFLREKHWLNTPREAPPLAESKAKSWQERQDESVWAAFDKKHENEVAHG